MDAKQLLQKYWGFSEFRDFQFEAIQSVLSQQDTLLVLPTGGGKSLCYQIPAILFGGITIVVSPLIALMEDQVLQLKKKGLHAECWHSGLSNAEEKRVLNNFLYTKDYLIFYVSPERLMTPIFQNYLDQVQVNLLAVDEAHCISQWGYNFRPSYLTIHAFRTRFPAVPIIALTATATPQVKADIITHLKLNDPKVFQGLIDKPNLQLYIYEETDKEKFLLNYVTALKGSGIIYLRRRTGTEQIAQLLSNYGCSVAYYHAGMDVETRALVQEQWVNGEVRVMVATNAFGMGIDKANVRWIIHMGIPPSIEEYYQEIGRAGRDGLDAKCYLLWDKEDIEKGWQMLEHRYPPQKVLQNILRAFIDFYQLPASVSYVKQQLEVNHFITHFELSFTQFHHAFKILDQMGILNYSEPQWKPASILLYSEKIHSETLAQLSPKLKEVVIFLMRSYAEIFWNPVMIDLANLAFELNLDKEDTRHRLKLLDQLGYVQYQMEGDFATIIFPEGRPHFKNLNWNMTDIDRLKQREIEAWEGMIDFVQGLQCKFKVLRSYFGEENTDDCGHCDIEYQRENDGEKGLDQMQKQLLSELKQGGIGVFNFVICQENEYLAKSAIRNLYRQKIIKYQNDLLTLNSSPS